MVACGLRPLVSRYAFLMDVMTGRCT